LKNDISLSVELNLNRTKNTRKSVIYGKDPIRSSLRVKPQRQASLKNDLYIYLFNKSRLVRKMHEEKCYIRKRTDIELPACENTKVCCVVKIQQMFINFNSWLIFGVGSD
jgi:hypothetical protein